MALFIRKRTIEKDIFGFFQKSLDFSSTQYYYCVVIPALNTKGLLPRGIHKASLDEVIEFFGNNSHRRVLLDGLRVAIEMLRNAGCRMIFLDGSFVTEKEVPQDYDACWDTNGVDKSLVDPVLFDFNYQRARQKAKYFGEFFPINMLEKNSGRIFLDFFQIDRESGQSKGIIAIDLRSI